MAGYSQLPFVANLLSSVQNGQRSPAIPRTADLSPALSQSQSPQPFAHLHTQPHHQLPPPPVPPHQPQAGPSRPAPPPKKRNRASTASTSTVAEGREEADDGDDEEGKARKRRVALSCLPCKTRKIKCDRKEPCSACIRRKIPHSCTWDHEDDATASFALDADVRHIARRLAHLESLFEITNPGLLPNSHDTSTGPAGPSYPSSIVNPSLHPSPASASFSPASPARRGLLDDMGDDSRHPQSDAEDAAINTLEDAVFGARVPVLRAVAVARKEPSQRGGDRPGRELTRAGTSIVAEPLSFDQDGRPRSAVRLGLDLAISTNDLPAARSASMQQIFAVLPGKEISDYLIQKYFAEMAWDYAPLDEESFISEHDRYREMLLEGRDDSIDPLWIANFCMLLALSLDGFWSRPSGAKNMSLFRGLNERELQDLPSVWHDAALRALQLGEWGGTPRIRTIQCVILMGQYIQLASSSGQNGRFLGWAASAFRIAQRLGLHRLGSNPETMPPDDPALPQGKNSLKREHCVRLFNQLVVIDSVLSDSPQFRCYILHPSQYNTCLPLNLNHSDLSRTEWRTISAAPDDIHTDGSFEIAQCALAAQIRRSLDSLVLGTAPFSYSRVLEQDREFRLILENLPEPFSERCPPLDSVKLRYQRALIHESIYSRVVRLHRPFLSRGYAPNSQFRYSSEQCVRASRLIVASNYELLRITNSLWWMYTSTLASAIVLEMDLFGAIDANLAEDEIKDRKDVLVKASIIFASQVASPALRAVVEQGRRILSGLFSAEDKRRVSRAAQALTPGRGNDLEPFGQVLQRISKEVAEEEQQLSSSNSSEYNPSAPVANPTFASGSGLRDDHVSYPPAPYPASSRPSLHQQEPMQFELSGWPDERHAQPGQDLFRSFYDTLASEDWTAAFASGSENGESSGLLGQMHATW